MKTLISYSHVVILKPIIAEEAQLVDLCLKIDVVPLVVGLCSKLEVVLLRIGSCLIVQFRCQNLQVLYLETLNSIQYLVAIKVLQ